MCIPTISEKKATQNPIHDVDAVQRWGDKFMINKDNFRQVLKKLGYEETGEGLEKKYTDFNTSMKVSFNDEKLIYPENIKGRTRNDGFDKPENFVVFECVTRLLDKGYRPEDIELERQWNLGHSPVGGRGDICVSDKNGATLLIIECKTWDSEYKKELARTKEDGGQLFSYWQQETACKWLELYSSDIKDDKIDRDSKMVCCSDDANIELLEKKDKTIKLYKNAHTVEEKHSAWKETYDSLMYDDMIFSSDSTAYNIGMRPLRKRDLKDFSADDKIVNRFEEILRHNNVSDKENAFNRLVALFICKLVDEINKADNDEVDFQYKAGADSYETLQDRLQHLHSTGMKELMGEDIYYVDDNYAERLFSNYTGQKRNEAIKDLKNTIRMLKFYSNNDFAFKDVHNEELFYQNGKILVEMVELFEKYRIVYPRKNQLLGDLFEQLLNKGFKQNEGQFFTPTPITRFIWDCLPVEKIINSDTDTVYPKVIDYACGAGHFLTEAVEAINFYSENREGNTWVRNCIYGIEKDYRLARVSKISLFMNGAGEGNIIFGDGLENNPDKGITDGSFDILVSNPPYSVKEFKQHLDLRNNTFELLERITPTGGEIETLFVERAAQLLKPHGVAAIILPTSILTNNTPDSYVGAREQILKNFYIRAVVSMGTCTFGKTDTTTAILFLEKFDEPPKKVSLCSDTVEAIFTGKSGSEWNDNDVLASYTDHIMVSEKDYSLFLAKKLNFEELNKIDYFKKYYNVFINSSDIKNFKNKKRFLNMTNDEQDISLLKNFYDTAFAIEKEKILYFSLVYSQDTIVISMPKQKDDQKDFLGYTWSDSKGHEGIDIKNPGGKMYDDKNRKAEGTLAATVRNFFDRVIPTFDDEKSKYGSIIKTKDMIDFSMPKFKKSINISKQRQFNIHTDFPLLRLDSYPDVIIEKGTSITEEKTTPGDYKVVAGGINYAYTSNIANRDENTITVSASGANAGYVNLWREKIFASDCTTIRTNSLTHTLWIYYYLKTIQDQILDVLQTGKDQPHVHIDDVKSIPVPNIDNDSMNRIVSECEKITNTFEKSCSKTDECHKKITRIYNLLDNLSKDGHKFSLNDSDKFEVLIGKRVLKDQLNIDGKIPVYSANVLEPFGYINELHINDFSKPSILWGIDGDWMTNYIPENKQFYPTDHCGVLRCKTSDVNPKYLCHILEREGSGKGYSRALRANLDSIQTISFSVPDIETQNKYINKIENIENEIEEMNETILSFDKKITDIITHNIIKSADNN